MLVGEGTMSIGRLVSGYRDFSLRMPGPLLGKGSSEGQVMIAEFKLAADVSCLAPYINAVGEQAVYFEKPPYIRFMLDGFLCTIYQDSGAAAAFSDRPQALAFMERLLVFLNDIDLRKDSIEPNHRRFRPISVLDIFRLLPRTNCRECGYATCMAFAAALSKRKTVSLRCPGFSRPMALNAVYPVLDNQGNLLSTVTIDIDANSALPESFSKTEHTELEESQRNVDGPVANNKVAVGNDQDTLPTPLTGRELAVLRLMAEGATNMEISKVLTISPHTVKSHVIHIFNKLGVDDRTQAAVWAARHNLI
jgi:DNA-binding CsgD family transcriptional regulator/ArsR family metal-binding transcriptional regulator